VGLGESSPMRATISDLAGVLEACWEELACSVVPGLLGRSVGSPEDIAELASGWGVGAFAAAGAETALWDLLGQARHASIAELLGASDLRIDMGVEAGLAVAPTSSIVELIQTIELHLDAGYRRVKINIRPGQDLEVVRAVRQHIGDVPLMVDAKGSYTLADLDVFRELDDYDLLMIEQPLAAADLDGLAGLQQAVSTPVCLDETADSPPRITEAIRRGAGRIVNLKLQRLGGLGPARAIHDLCYQNGVDCWIGAMPELGIGQAHAIHLATLPNCKYPSDIEPSARWFVDDCTIPLVELAGPGIIEVPTRPGLGFHVDPVKLRRYQVRQQEFTRRSSA
jgi:O-succinylbenzoate synthase